MKGIQWEAHIVAEARLIAQRAKEEDFPVELDCARGIYVAMIDCPRVLAGAAFMLDGKTFKFGPLEDIQEA